MTVRPRIRTLKPETWHDEKVGAISRDARLLFIVLITIADDQGRFRALPSVIIGHGYPYDSPNATTIRKWLGELVDVGLLVLYGVRDEYGWLRGWSKHQKINRASDSQLPAPPIHGAFSEESLNAHDALTAGSGSLPNGLSDVG